MIETGETWVVPSVMPAGEAVRGVSAAAENPATLEEAVRAAGKAAAALIGDFYEMEARFWMIATHNDTLDVPMQAPQRNPRRPLPHPAV